jgi:hypothetical protein
MIRHLRFVLTLLAPIIISAILAAFYGDGRDIGRYMRYAIGALFVFYSAVLIKFLRKK